jgi:hypothetical protein
MFRILIFTFKNIRLFRIEIEQIFQRILRRNVRLNNQIMNNMEILIFKFNIFVHIPIYIIIIKDLI